MDQKILRQALIRGFQDHDWWMTGEIPELVYGFGEHKSAKYSHIKKFKTIPTQACKDALKNLGVSDNPERICSEFIDRNFFGPAIEKWLKY